MHAHNVFFVLKDKSPEKIEQFVTDSRKYMGVLPGIVSFECGVRQEKCQREFNDLDWDVSLHVIFENMEAHDAYQAAENHQVYLSRNQANWASARVFDATIK